MASLIQASSSTDTVFFDPSLTRQVSVNQTLIKTGRFFTPRAIKGVGAGLLALHFILVLSAATHKSNTFDEMTHLTAGYACLKTGDFRFDPESGNLPKRWAAIPLLFMDMNFPQPAKHAQDWDPYRNFFYDLENDADTMLFCGRAMIALLSVVLGLVVFLWSKSIFGETGGLISLALYAFSPTMLAHAGLVTSDMAAALFFTAATWALWRAMRVLTVWSVTLAAILVGCLIVSKISGVLIVYVAGFLFIIRLIWGGPINAGFFRARPIAGFWKGGIWVLIAMVTAALGVVCVIWAFYGFRYWAAPPGSADWPEHVMLAEQGTGPAQDAVDFLNKHKLLPESFLLGCSDVAAGAGGREAFLNNRYSINGWWWFFPFCFAAKTPLVLFAILGLSGVAMIKARDSDLVYKALGLLALIAVYGAFAMASNLNIGHRHILPVYPALFILAGAAANMKQAFFPALACVFVFAAQSLMAWPHYLAYFNIAAGGSSQGYRQLVDSSLDWGQDLPALAAWFAENKPHQNKISVYLTYFGTARPSHFGIKARMLPPVSALTKDLAPLVPGWYCISATYLQQINTGVPGHWCEPMEQTYQKLKKFLLRFDDPASQMAMAEKAGGQKGLAFLVSRFKMLRFARLCHFLRQRNPDAMAGWSICIYRVSMDELSRAVSGPVYGLPLTPEVKGAKY